MDDRVPPLMLRVEEAAKVLSIGERLAWELVWKGDRGEPDGLHAVRIGAKLRRVPVWEIQRYARFLAGEELDTMPDAWTTTWVPQVAPFSPSGRGG